MDEAVVPGEAALVPYLSGGLQVARSVASAAGPAEAYKAVLPALCPELPSVMARLWLRETRGEEMVCVDWWRARPQLAAVARPPFGVTCRRGVGLAGECWAAGQPIASPIVDADHLFPNHAELVEAGIQAAAAVPLPGVGGMVGVLTLYFDVSAGLDDRGLELLAVLGDAIGPVIEAKQRDAGAREQLRRNELVLDASSAVASAGGYQETLRMLAASSVPGLADLCLIDLVTSDGRLERVAGVHADPAKAALVEELKRYYVPRIGSPHPAGQVTLTGRSIWSATMSNSFLHDTTRDQRHYEIVKELGFTSYLSVPLRAGEDLLGAITLISAGSGRVFTEEDVSTGERLAEQVAGTIARARELDREQQRTAELEVRSRALLELGTELSAAQSVEDALAALLRSPVCSLGATAARIGLLDDSRELLQLTFSGAVSAETVNRYHLIGMDGPLPIVKAVSSNRPVVIADTADLGRHYHDLVDDSDVRAVAFEPLCGADGSVLGAFGLSWSEPHHFTRAELELLSAVASALSRAVARILVAEREHEVAASLQERLLAVDVGSASVVVSTAYRPAGGTMRVGGDWYTARVLDAPDRVGVSVGDVVGHGLGAVTTMSQLRSALDIAALGEEDPAAVLALLDRYARGVPDASCATVAYARFDAGADTVSYACAGHPYPVLVMPDGDVQLLTDGRSAPLGTQPEGVAVRSGTAPLPPGALLVLYSDGLIERHGESLQAGLDRLASAAAGCAQMSSGAACHELLARMVGHEGYRDDVVVVALRPVGTTPDSHVDCIPASFDEIPGARHRLRAWIEGLGLGGHSGFDILLAVGEAVNNAIEHASDQDPRRLVGIEAFAMPEWVDVSVTDAGQWIKDSAVSRRSAERGRGLTLIHGLSYNVDMVRSSVGTRVTMTFRRSPQARGEAQALR